MKNLLIIPDVNDLESSISLAKEYNLGFEFNDFFKPGILDDGAQKDAVIKKYKSFDLPTTTTLHGAFFDVLPFSVDEKIREISMLRINQSLNAGREMNVKAVVFHTNYNPFLNSFGYIDEWINVNTKIWQKILKDNKDVNIYLENMFDVSPIILKKLAENLSENENFGVCLDWAHATISGVTPQKWAEELSGFVKHIHINDNDLKSDLHLAWGEGQINRNVFYDCYEKYFEGTTVLVETPLLENKLKSLEQLKKDGFLN